MLRPRAIPCLLLHEGALVKSVRFRDLRYVGDPLNVIAIFNELEVDELVLLDIGATPRGAGPDFALLAQVASECFMPLTYGGGVRTVEDAREALRIGCEKVVINGKALEEPVLVTRVADAFGSQAVVASFDVKRGLSGHYHVHVGRGTRDTGRDPVAWALELEARGAGELLVAAIERDGTWSGFDLGLIRSVTEAVHIPVIASGGAGTLAHIRAAIRDAGASAVALGSMVVYQKQDLGVLINFPARDELDATLA
ncbi:MAG: imidazole glycerol phosphate synthase subunit HisF [Alphaproteobacteria bacterium]|nr:imidazole glycerol phosphate synthase subunit HisF [Alphaproteobacteria bacterium]